MIWIGVKDGDPRALALIKEHYSWRIYRDNRPHRRFCGPGYKMVLLTPRCDALFIWRKFRDQSACGGSGVNCAAFRNMGPGLSSELIKEAMVLAWARWPGERLYTYVNPKRIRSSNPGFCFLKAGWAKLPERTKGNLVILEAIPSAAGALDLSR